MVSATRVRTSARAKNMAISLPHGGRDSQFDCIAGGDRARPDHLRVEAAQAPQRRGVVASLYPRVVHRRLNPRAVAVDGRAWRTDLAQLDLGVADTPLLSEAQRAAIEPTGREVLA